jgi:hypothetical protein
VDDLESAPSGELAEHGTSVNAGDDTSATANDLIVSFLDVSVAIDEAKY